MPNFFSKYPKIDYTFADGTVHKLSDINVKYALSSLVKSTSDVFYPFAYRDQDRPDIIADKYYDSSDYYWLVLMSNDIFDINSDLPLSQDVFNKHLAHKYKPEALLAGHTENPDDILGYCFDTIHHYENSEGYIIDHDTFISIGNTRSVSIFDYEFSENEKKRAIRFIENSRKQQIKNELEDKLRQLKSDLGQ
jgi:hypothetical protein